MSSRSCLSSAESGSSISRMRGSNTMARASATRWRWPPESCVARRVRRSPPSCTISSACSTRCAKSAVEARRAAERESDVRRDAHMREQRVVLEHHAQLALVRRETDHLAVAEEQAAVVGPGEAGEHHQSVVLPEPEGRAASGIRRCGRRDRRRRALARGHSSW